MISVSSPADFTPSDGAGSTCASKPSGCGSLAYAVPVPAAGIGTRAGKCDHGVAVGRTVTSTRGHIDTRRCADDGNAVGDNADQPGRYWNGWIDDVRIYSYALNEAEITTLYTAGQEAAIPSY